MKRIYLIFAASLAVLISCTVIDSGVRPAAQKVDSQLQVRERQTREFDTNDTKLVLKAVLNTLQDDGFIVKNANTELGLLTAQKEVDMNSSSTSKNSDDNVWGAIFDSMLNSNRNRNTNQQNKPVKKFKLIEVSVNVSEIGSRSKVRANFQAKILDDSGKTLDVYEVDDLKFYQDFFAKVDKGIFIQKSGL